MRILHTSDLHFGFSLGNTPFTAEQRYMAEQLIGIAHGEKADAVVIAGDVFNYSVASAEALSIYDSLMTSLCVEEGIPVMVCAGNHDGAARLASCSSLLARAGLYVVGSIRGGVKTVELEGCDFHLLPYFSIDEAKFLYPNAEIETYQQAFSILLDGIRTRFARGRKNILAAHCFVSGAVANDPNRMDLMGGAQAVPAALFEGFDYVALGHLHRAQDIGNNIRYSCTPMKLSFGETVQQKTVTMLDTETMERKTVPVSFLRDLRVVEGTYEEALAIAEADARKDDYMKVVLNDVYAHQEVQEAFRNFYPNLLAMEGKAYVGSDKPTELRVDEVAALSLEAVMQRFYTEYTDGVELSEKQLAWFRKAEASAAREGGGGV